MYNTITLSRKINRLFTFHTILVGCDIGIMINNGYVNFATWQPINLFRELIAKTPHYIFVHYITFCLELYCTFDYYTLRLRKRIRSTACVINILQSFRKAYIWKCIITWRVPSFKQKTTIVTHLTSTSRPQTPNCWIYNSATLFLLFWLAFLRILFSASHPLLSINISSICLLQGRRQFF